jgi:hypothetical protein
MLQKPRSVSVCPIGPRDGWRCVNRRPCWHSWRRALTAGTLTAPGAGAADASPRSRGRNHGGPPRRTACMTCRTTTSSSGSTRKPMRAGLEATARAVSSPKQEATGISCRRPTSVLVTRPRHRRSTPCAPSSPATACGCSASREPRIRRSHRFTEEHRSGVLGSPWCLQGARP